MNKLVKTYLHFLERLEVYNKMSVGRGGGRASGRRQVHGSRAEGPQEQVRVNDGETWKG